MCVKCTDGCKEIGSRKELTHTESKNVFGPKGILRTNCYIYNKQASHFGHPVTASMKRVDVEDLQSFRCHAKNCSVHVKLARCNGGFLLYEEKDPATFMPYQHQNHHEFLNDIYPNNQRFTPYTISVHQIETVLENWGNLTVGEIIHKMKNDKEIMVNDAQLSDIDHFKKTVLDWTCRQSTRMNQT